MMLDAVAFDLGGARSPQVAFPDASGLAPLTLPEEFLRGQSHQPQAELPPDTVRRFETAMSEESKLPPSVVESLMAHMSSGSPTVAGQESESLKVKSPAVEGPKVKSLTVESLKVKNPTVEGLMVESRKSEVASVVNPVSAVSVERPVVVTVDTVVHGDSVVRLADEKRVVASPERPKAPMVAAAEKQIEGVAVGRGSMTGDGIIPPRPFGALPLSQGESLMSHPQHSDITKTFVQSADRPFVSVGERPTVEVVEAPKVVTVEKPVTIAHPAVSTIASAVLENLVNRVRAEGRPVVASSTPIAPVAEPIAIVEPPSAVDKPIGTSVEHSARVAVEESGDASVNAPIPADSVRRSVDENPVVASPERPAIQVSATIPEEPIVIVEKTPTLSADKPVASAVEASKVVAVEKPVVPAVEAPKVATVHPTVATVEVPKVVTTEKPLTVVLPTAHTIVPAVVENLKGRVEVEEQPMAASAILASPTTPTTATTPTTPDAPPAKPVVMVETPVAIDKPIGSSVEHSVRVAVEGTVVESVNPTIQESSVVRSADERPMAATVERPVAVVPDKPTVVTAERSVAVAPEKPVVEIAEKPVVLATPVAPTVVPVVQENPGDPVKAERHPVAASSTPIIPDAPAMRPDALVEAPVAVEKPFVAPSENAPIQVSVPTPAEPGVIREKTPVVSDERPVAAKVSQQTVATVDKPEEKAVAAAVHVVVAPAAVEASAPQALQAAPEVAAASAASARTEAIVETVNQIVEAVVGQILVTPGITHGECEIKILLKPTVLDGSEITMSAKDGTLTVGITPATQEASAAAAAALPRLEIALAEHAPVFHHVSVALQLKKGTRNEAV